MMNYDKAVAEMLSVDGALAAAVVVFFKRYDVGGWWFTCD